MYYDGEWKAVEGSKYFDSPMLYNEGGFKKREDAEKLIGELRDDSIRWQGLVENVTKKKENKNAPLLFNLAEIQNECSKKFKINPEKLLVKFKPYMKRKCLHIQEQMLGYYLQLWQKK